MFFNWDARKAAANLKKPGSPSPRLQKFSGMICRRAFLIPIIRTWRNNIRIISARRMTTAERKAYER